MAVVESNAPLPESKPTRQWDAWTREEEENFFGALRQVGKNFEKITSRVQTKNKDQVRHYYYRVIKRMNRILSPSLVLDARNSSYVNSAMLRWWSLLEKHSCSASKLRLKPRRFKTFVTALEHQLLKDRKKPKKKPPPSASSKKVATPTEASDGVSIESGECNTSGILSSKAPVDELQSSQSVGAGRKTAVKRKAANNGSRKSGARSEAKRPPKPRKKPADGKRTKAANGKWEKEGSLGFTSMADAAAELVQRDAAAEGNLPDTDSCNTNCKTHPEGNDVTVDPQTRHISSATSAAFSKLVLLDKLPRDFPCGNPRERPGLVNVTPVAGSNSATTSTPTPLLNTKDTWPPLEIIPDLSFEAQKSLALLRTRCNNCNSLRCKGVEELKSDNADAKVKLQLFPFDDRIRKALEQESLCKTASGGEASVKVTLSNLNDPEGNQVFLPRDGLNPHLELTLKARKSISSVLNHLTQKWGRASVATGELRLFPFSTQWSSIALRQSWSQLDSDVSAADVHAALGNPAVFRLKYAWFPSRVLETSAAVLQQGLADPSTDALDPGNLLPVGSPCSDMSDHILQSASASGRANATIGGISYCHPLTVSAEYRNSMQESTSAKVSLDASTGIESEVLADAALMVVQSPDSSAIPVVSSSTCPVVEAKADVDSKQGPPTRAVEDSLDFRPSGAEVVPFIPCEAEVASKATSKLQDGAAQLPGCGWLYESTDGFAQQLWNIEDSLRSNQGVSMTQMDWVDSLTNISVSELLGDGLSLPANTPQSGLEQPHLNHMDTFDIPLSPAVRESHLEPSSSALWGGEETCDAFSFQKEKVSGYSSKETVHPLNHEISVSSLGLDTGFRDIAPLSWREQLQSSQNQDLLFGGEASLGLGGLIEALAANGSLDGFQAELFTQLSEEMNLDLGVKQDLEVSSKNREGNIHGWDVAVRSPKARVSVPMTSVEKDSTSLVDNSANITGKLFGRGRNDNVHESSEVIGGCINYSNVSVQAGESDMVRPASCRPQLQQGIRQASVSPPRPIKLSGRYTNMRSLKLQT